MTQLKKSTLFVAGALSLGAIAPAVAQTADPSMGEIVVTARRMDERLQDVPISIQVFNQQELTNRNITSGADLAQYTPSLSVDFGTFGRDDASFSIRGFTQTLGTTASVAVYFADVVAPRGADSGTESGDGAPAGNFFDLQNVQVLEGPQGTLFGRNTTGGAVLLVPQKPTDKFDGYVEGSYGNYNMRRVQGVANIPASDKVRLRFGIDRELRDGYITNDSGIGPTRFDNINYISIRGSMVVDLSDSLENYTIGTFNRSRNTGPLPQLFVCNPSVALLSIFACAQTTANKGEGFYTAQSNYPDPYSLNKTWQIIDTTTWHASDDLTVKNIFGFGEIRNYLASGLFGTDWSIPAGVPGIGGAPFPFTNSTPPPGEASNAKSTLSEELQLQGHALDKRLTWQVGGYFEKSRPLGLSGSQTPNLISCTNSATFQCTDVVGDLIGAPGFVGAIGLKQGENTYRNLAAYGQATYSIMDQLKATAGLRYTSDKDDASVQQITYSFPTPNTPVPACLSTLTTMAANCYQYFHVKSNAPTWVLDLEYTPIQDTLLYAKWSRGYRQGAVDTTSADGYQAFGPEHVDTYEVGEKTTFHGNVSGLFNLSAFYNDFRDQQLQVGFIGRPGVSSAAGITNAGKSRIWGFEVEAAISPIKPLTFTANYTYLNTKILQIQPIVLPAGSAYIGTSVDLAPGDPLPGSPKNKATLTGTYTLPIPESYGRLSASLTYTYTDRLFLSTSTPFGHIPAYELMNLNVDWETIAGKPVDAELFVTNLTNKEYVASYSTLYSVAGFEDRTPGEPRMVGARLRVHFGVGAAW